MLILSLVLDDLLFLPRVVLEFFQPDLDLTQKKKKN